jgi:hypothetical protein
MRLLRYTHPLSRCLRAPLVTPQYTISYNKKRKKEKKKKKKKKGKKKEGNYVVSLLPFFLLQ